MVILVSFGSMKKILYFLVTFVVGIQVKNSNLGEIWHEKCFSQFQFTRKIKLINYVDEYLFIRACVYFQYAFSEWVSLLHFTFELWRQPSRTFQRFISTIVYSNFILIHLIIREYRLTPYSYLLVSCMLSGAF